MGDVTDFLFGGSDDSAFEQQLLSNEANLELQRQQAERARADVSGIFPNAIQNQVAGSEAAVQALTGTLPFEEAALQEGTSAAINTLRSGADQRQRAILGLSTNPDLIGAPRPYDFDRGFFNAFSNAATAGAGQAFNPVMSGLSGMTVDPVPPRGAGTSSTPPQLQGGQQIVDAAESASAQSATPGTINNYYQGGAQGAPGTSGPGFFNGLPGGNFSGIINDSFDGSTVIPPPTNLGPPLPPFNPTTYGPNQYVNAGLNFSGLLGGMAQGSKLPSNNPTMQPQVSRFGMLGRFG